MKLFMMVIACWATGWPALADFLVIPIETASVPYALSPNNYANSPANYENSSANYENSDANYSNSEANYKNSAANYENSLSGKRRLIASDNTMIGYYVFSDNGVLNFYNAKGRIAYMPSGGETQSLFLAQGGGWCGTLGTANGKTVVGMTQRCLLQFIADQ
ncbi:hypothetical protein [Agrobacterium cavarae]|uniref:hypothetical protein n=1 Tax=Agrobacterium cavarae TaxID=2528239 RepID=UPI003FD511AA